ncbi:MAG: MFS transporter [Betaproteobacteria bacterium]|nr:MFS transporter [Betaproteobacteria bacterium]
MAHSTRNQFVLLGQRRFAPFFWTQFLGAGNDNVFKFALTILVTYHAATWSSYAPEVLVNAIAAVFILPFLLFSATAGQLADKFDKGKLIRLIKALEVLIMGIAWVGFADKSIALLFTALFLMGLHSTFFGPVKYAYLPQHLDEAELVGGNGLVEMGTFVAILAGTMLGGLLIRLPGGEHYVAIATFAIAAAGLFMAQFVPRSSPPAPQLSINWNPFSETWRNLGFARQKRVVFLSILGISWLWFFGATFLTQFATFAKSNLSGDETVVTLLLAVFSLGIGLGSLLCERLSGHKVEIGLVPFGSIGMTVFAVDLYFASRSLDPGAAVGFTAFLRETANWRVIADLFLLAMFSGFYSVPLYALIQARCAATHRSRIIAANNILNALFMIAAAGMGAALLAAGVSIPVLFLLTGMLNALVAIYIYTLVPEFLLRFLAWLLIHSMYRLRLKGRDHLPEESAAVLICNHVSYVDALVIAAACPRPVRFVMDHRIFQTPLLGAIFRAMKTIPIAAEKEDAARKERAFQEIAQALQDGDLICIFPEGKLTPDGEMSTFKSGIMRILADTPVPVIPMALRGLWGSFFSRYSEGKAFRRWRGVFSRIELVVGAPWAPPSPRPPPEAVPPPNDTHPLPRGGGRGEGTQVSPEALQAKILEMRGMRR